MADTGGSEPHGGEVPAPQIRASHEDRDRVAEQLRVAAGDGRLTVEELDERLEVALQARTVGELALLTTDLPAARVAGSVAKPEPKDLMSIEVTSGHAVRTGSWVVPRRMEVRVRSGHVRLDLTEAVISESTLLLDAEVRSGHLTLVTKPGIVVDTSEVTVRSGHTTVREPWSGARVPTVLRVEVSGRVGSGHISARPPRRNLWQWLARRPKRWSLPPGA